jgi:hypothetical protein
MACHRWSQEIQQIHPTLHKKMAITVVYPVTIWPIATSSSWHRLGRYELAWPGTRERAAWDWPGIARNCQYQVLTSTFIHEHPSIYLSIHLFISIYIYLYLYISIYIYLYLAIYVYIYLSNISSYLSISLSIYLSIHLSIYLFIYLSILFYSILFLSILFYSILF